MSRRKAKAVGLIVAGMHRSGTSALTGGLQALGFALGRDLLPPAEDNPKGYFEHVRAVEIDDKLLDCLDRRWDDVRRLPEGFSESEAGRAARREIAGFLQSEFSAQRVFAIKDPRMCRLLGVWLPAFDDSGVEARILLAARHPAEVAASLAKRNGLPPLVSELLWLRYMLEAERDSRNCRRVCVTYDQFMDAPLPAIRAALGALAIVAPAKQGDGEIQAFVTKGDRHFRSGHGLGSSTPLRALATNVYECFVALAHGRDLPAETFDGFRKDLERELDASAPFVDALSGVALDFRRKAEEIDRDLAKVRSDLLAQLDWSKSAVARHDALHAQLADASSALNAQLQWSGQAVAEREMLQAELAEAKSELKAQLDWSVRAVAEREQMNVALAEANAARNAQVEWSRQAVEEREALQAELAKVRSDLQAQVDWSAYAVAERDRLDVALAEAKAGLRAQVEWSRQSVEEREALQVELAKLRSDLKAQVDWSIQAVEERERMNVALAEANAAFNAQVAWSEQAVAEREALQAELAKVRSELNAQLDWSRQAVAERERLQAALADANATLDAQVLRSEQAISEREALQDVLAKARQDLTAMADSALQAKAQRAHLQARLATAESGFEAHKEAARNAATQAEAERGLLHAALSDARTDLRAERDLAKEMSARFDQLRAEFEAANAEGFRLQGMLDEARAIASGLQARIDRYEQTLVGRIHRAWVDRRTQKKPNIT